MKCSRMLIQCRALQPNSTLKLSLRKEYFLFFKQKFPKKKFFKNRFGCPPTSWISHTSFFISLHSLSSKQVLSYKISFCCYKNKKKTSKSQNNLLSKYIKNIICSYFLDDFGVYPAPATPCSFLFCKISVMIPLSLLFQKKISFQHNPLRMDD